MRDLSGESLQRETFLLPTSARVALERTSRVPRREVLPGVPSVVLPRLAALDLVRRDLPVDVRSVAGVDGMREAVR
jgi:hypothetical protein